MFSLSQILFYGFLVLLLFFILRYQLKRMRFIQRVKNLIGRRLDVFEPVQETDEDDGFVDDEFLFADLNPEQSVERYRRLRFEAAAAVMANATNQEEPACRRSETTN